MMFLQSVTYRRTKEPRKFQTISHVSSENEWMMTMGRPALAHEVGRRLFMLKMQWVAECRD